MSLLQERERPARDLVLQGTAPPSPARTSIPRPALLVLAWTLAGFVLRMPNGDRQLEYDEVISIFFAQHGFGDIVRATVADTMPPLYYWLLHLWNPTGENLFLARYLSTVLSVPAIPLLFAIGRRLVGGPAAAVGAALLAVSPFAVFYGGFARMYALLALLGLLAVFFFLRWLHQPRTRDLALFTAAATLSLYVHHLAALQVLSLDLLFLLGLRRWPGGWLNGMLIAHAALGLAFLPWLPYLAEQIGKVNRAFWIPPPGLAEAVRTALVFHFHLPLPAGAIGPAALLSGVAVAVTAVEVRRRWMLHDEARTPLLAGITLAIVPIALMFLLSQVRPVYVERAVLAAAGFYYLLLGAALMWLPHRLPARALTGLLGLGILAALLYQRSYEEFPRSPFREAAGYLASRAGPDSAVLHDNKLSFFPTHFFDRNLPQQYVADVPGSPNDTLAPGTIEVLGLYPVTPEEAVAGKSTLWFVVFRRALDEAARSGVPLPNKQWLDERFEGELAASAGDLAIYRYRVARQ